MAKSSRKGKKEPPRAPPAPRSRAPWGLVLLLVVPAVALVWLLRGGTRRAPEEPEPPEHPAAARSASERRGPTAAQPSAAKRGPRGAGGDAPARPDRPGSGERPGLTEESVEGKSPAEKRLFRARATLDNYLETTRYPFTSQPLSRHADVAIPNFVPSVKLPLSRPDRKPTDAKVTVGQDRAFVHGAESVTLRITCENSEGPQPCVFEKPPMAFVRKDQRGADVIPPSPVPFVPDGGDPSNQIAHFTPAKQGFAAYDGQIAIEGQLKVGSDDGGVSWQITYTRAAPAVFTKKTREVMENGSLSIYVGMTVEKPGRYVVTARAFSKDKKGFGYLQFNDELPRGAAEAKLVVFGKLVHDEKVETPFEIRDVEGFLLRDGGHPDREIMAMLPGTVLTTKTYPLKDFSEAAWSSEEKDRHVSHYKEEIDTAKADVDKEQSAGAGAGAGGAPPLSPARPTPFRVSSLAWKATSRPSSSIWWCWSCTSRCPRGGRPGTSRTRRERRSAIG